MYSGFCYVQPTAAWNHTLLRSFYFRDLVLPKNSSPRYPYKAEVVVVWNIHQPQGWILKVAFRRFSTCVSSRYHLCQLDKTQPKELSGYFFFFLLGCFWPNRQSYRHKIIYSLLGRVWHGEGLRSVTSSFIFGCLIQNHDLIFSVHPRLFNNRGHPIWKRNNSTRYTWLRCCHLQI